MVRHAAEHLRHDGAHYVTVQLTRPLADLWECFDGHVARAETVIDWRPFSDANASDRIGATVFQQCL